TDTVSKMTKKKTLALTTSQAVTTSSAVTTSPYVTKSTAQPKQSISDVAPLLILLDNQGVQPNPKEESDVYRFRPAATASTAAAEQANVTVTPKKIIYPLSLSQSPVI